MCRISDTSWSIAYVALPLGNLPGPGDRGSPLIQDGRVVGLMHSINMHNWKGIAISAEMIMREINVYYLQHLAKISMSLPSGFMRIIVALRMNNNNRCKCDRIL
ncbi:MAG: hypothetical protein M0Q13_10460 [Methanothrix sp.]|nr:hypothetical protein [Methanothrix sp.]